jgi:hypothetical protein
MNLTEIRNHRLADALAEIVDIVRELQRTTDMRDDGQTLLNETPENRIARHTLNNLDNWLPLTQNEAEKLEWTLLSVKSVCPVEPLNDEDRLLVFEAIADTWSDLRGGEITSEYTANWKDWQWRAELDDIIAMGNDED